jgi:hypothetical protein
VRLVEVVELGHDVGGRAAGGQQLRRRADPLDPLDRTACPAGGGA